VRLQARALALGAAVTVLGGVVVGAVGSVAIGYLDPAWYAALSWVTRALGLAVKLLAGFVAGFSARTDGALHGLVGVAIGSVLALVITVGRIVLATRDADLALPFSWWIGLAVLFGLGLVAGFAGGAFGATARARRDGAD
jgi:hypothetical protein